MMLMMVMTMMKMTMMMRSKQESRWQVPIRTYHYHRDDNYGDDGDDSDEDDNNDEVKAGEQVAVPATHTGARLPSGGQRL